MERVLRIKSSVMRVLGLNDVWERLGSDIGITAAGRFTVLLEGTSKKSWKVRS